MGKNAWSFALMAAFMAVGVLAQAPSPSASSTDCTSAITSLSPCLSFVITGSNETKPGNDCCTALSAIVSTKVLCLCQVLSGNNNLGLPINRTQALSLPGACNVKTPPISQCAAAGAPLASAANPVSSPVSSPKTAKTPAKAPAALTPAPTKATATPLSPAPTPAPTKATPTPLSPAPIASPTAPSRSPSVAPTVSSATAPSPSPSVASSPPGPASPSLSPSSSPSVPATTANPSAPTTSSPGPPTSTPGLTPQGSTSSAVAVFTPSTLLVLAGVALASLQL